MTSSENKSKNKKPVVPPSVRARLQHSSENTSDYLEIIARLIAETGEARVVDVAHHLGVSKATVSKKVTQMQREGYVKTEPYRSIFLKPAGAKIANEARRVHRIVYDFLVTAGVPEHIAEIDSEGIEHHVSNETINILEQLTKQLRAEQSDKI